MKTRLFFAGLFLVSSIAAGMIALASAQPVPSILQVVSASKEVLVPAGQFVMGCKPDLAQQWNLQCDSDATPLHAVHLASFYIDQTEVTNAQYAACVVAGKCAPPLSVDSPTRSGYFDNPAYANYPVMHVDWPRADEYCQWVGKRLPTEAQWEKAARGTDLRPFAWGSGLSCERANVRIGDERCVGDTRPVGSYPNSASPYGALDMTGNVIEWVNDIYARSYYHWSPYYDPQGATSNDGRGHLVRGGSWLDDGSGSTTWVRMDDGTDETYKIGFRCARNAPGIMPTATPAPTPTPLPAPVSRSIGPEGGLVWQAYPLHLTMLNAPAEAVNVTRNFTISYDQRPDRQFELQGINHFFSIDADSALQTPLSVTLGYPERLPLISNSLGLYRLDTLQWVTDGITITRVTTGAMWAYIDRTGAFGLLGQTNSLYLPLVLR